MNLSEFNKYVSSVYETEQENYEKAKKDFENGNYDQNSHYYILDKRCEVFVDIEGYTIDESIEKLIDKKHDIENLSKSLDGFYSDYQLHVDVDDFYINYSYYELADESYIQSRVNEIVRKYVRKELKPKNSDVYDRPVDCKFLSLFKEGKITWEDLQRIVYSDCEI